MTTWCSDKHQSPLLIFMLLLIFMVGVMQAVCIEDERKALLEIKASLHELSYRFNVDNPLSTWVDHGIASGECCKWERIKCDKTTGHITRLSLSNVFSLDFERDEYYDKNPLVLWQLNFSQFHHFKELRSLDLSWNYIGYTISSTGLEGLSSLKKLELLNLSTNYVETKIFPSLGALTSLKVLDLSYVNGYEGSSSIYEISEFSILENLEVLDLSQTGCHGTLQGSKMVSMLKKLKVLNLRYNDQFNESLIKSLSHLSSLKVLDLFNNRLSGSFPSQELSHLTKLEKLDLSANKLNYTSSIQDCKSLMRLGRLESISLGGNNFNKSIISCLSFLPSLKNLDLSGSYLGSSFLTQELSFLRELRMLDLSFCGLPSLTLNALASFRHLEILDLGRNNFVGSIPSTIKSLSSLKVISFAYNQLNGSLPNHGLCELKNLHELSLKGNMLNGNLPECLGTLLHLNFIDISSNQFSGTLPPSLIANLTSLEYLDFSHNKFEGPFLFSSFSNHKNIEIVSFISDNDKFEVETEDPIGWNPMFQLKGLALSNCNVNMHKGSVIPSFLLHQHKLKKLDLSHNSLEGKIPNWLIENNTILEFLSLRNNSFGGLFGMPFYRNPNIRWLDMSGNLMKGPMPRDIQKFLPSLTHLNLSRNYLEGVIPSLVGDLGELEILDLSHNGLFGEVPLGLFTNLSELAVLTLSNNRFHGELLSGNLSLGNLDILHLDSNYFSGKIGKLANEIHALTTLKLLDISNNFFTGLIPGWITNNSYLSELVVRNNMLVGQFPCGITSFTFLDISQNYFSGSIPSCLNLQWLEHLHLGSNIFTGSIPDSFSNLTNILTLDIGKNKFSGRIPKFLGELSNIRILILGKNKLSGSIPKQLCQLKNASLIDLSSNFLSGTIPGCLQNITGPTYQAFMQVNRFSGVGTSYYYRNTRNSWFSMLDPYEMFGIQDEVLFTTKTLSYTYKGSVLDIMSGLDLSCNKLTGDIPEELGLLTQIRVFNVSHNQLTGPIPVNFSNLVNIESLDLSFNSLSGKVPSELIKLNSLAFFNVSYNNLSGRLPEMKAQFSTFNKESYKGNPLLCGPPLEKECTIQSSVVINPTNEERSYEKWYSMDMASFYGSCGSTWFVFMLGFVALLYVNPYWRRRWLDFVEECMYACYYFLCDLVSKPSSVGRV